MSTPLASPTSGIAPAEYLAFAREEYFHLQKTVEDYDGRALTIKAWSVTVSAAAVSAAYTEHEHMLLWVGAVSALMFWLVEALWKSFQAAFFGRIKEIEAAFGAGTVPVAPRITTTWHASWSLGRLARILFAPHVLLPHVGIFAGAAVLLVLGI